MSNLLQAPYFNPQTYRPARPGEPAGTNLPVRPAAAPEPLARLLVPHDGRLLVVRLEELDWIESSGNYVRLHRGDSALVYRQTLTALVDRLDPRRFVRIHRTAVVNLDSVAELTANGSGVRGLKLRDGRELPVSRRMRAGLLSRVGRI